MKYSEAWFYNIVTNYLEKDGQNEIDLIAVNEADRHIIIGEVKRKKKRISIPALQEKAKNIMGKKKHFSFEFVGLSMDDM